LDNKLVDDYIQYGVKRKRQVPTILL